MPGSRHATIEKRWWFLLDDKPYYCVDGSEIRLTSWIGLSHYLRRVLHIPKGGDRRISGCHQQYLKMVKFVNQPIKNDGWTSRGMFPLFLFKKARVEILECWLLMLHCGILWYHQRGIFHVFQSPNKRAHISEKRLVERLGGCLKIKMYRNLAWFLIPNWTPLMYDFFTRPKLVVVFTPLTIQKRTQKSPPLKSGKTSEPNLHFGVQNIRIFE